MDDKSINTQYSYSGNELQVRMKFQLNMTLMQSGIESKFD
jgi:hypothetical protein